ncbi:S66 peptidase family protein [Bacillus massilinigeriensis]|uniref:S66 peptidase family protein n=1 Tax=Bacillus mediterraneensis TaxID=1805474 RepID=UPI0008F94878|nr:LD-carboxypeptidase [Bacillus mediterraneensis]
MKKPPSLKAGDTVGVIAPASPPDEANLERGIDFLQSKGLKIKRGEYLLDKDGYLAGPDEARIKDLHRMFADEEVKAIFCAGGGYGAARIAAHLDYELISNQPKIFWGYSDITFLHIALQQNANLVTFHGPMLASDIGKPDASSISKSFFQQLFSEMPLVYSSKISPLEVFIPGIAEGTLTGGNLTLVSSTLGTSFEIDTEGKLLLLEDLNEEPRAVDRMMNQLYMAKKLQTAAGIIIGDFLNCVPRRKGSTSLSLQEVLCHYLSLAGRPAMGGFLFGHSSPNIGLPLGVKAILNTKTKQLKVDSGISLK